MSDLSLIDFWVIRRKALGEKAIVKPFHRKKAQILTDLMLGRLPKPNLLILEPPRMGKTDLGVQAFIEWSLSYFPDSEFIHGTWGADLATSTVKKIRDTLVSSWYREICSSEFGASVQMKGDQAAGRQDFFHTQEGGSVKGVGAGTGVIGFGAGKLRPEFGGALVIDDALKHQERNSPTVRKATIDWVTGLESRRNRKEDPMTPMILVQQRLHPQDPPGHFLSTQRDRWNVIEFPALDESGESLWPARISKEELEFIKKTNPEQYWAEYMQQPSNELFQIFKPAWWKFWDDIKEVERRITLKIITADTAFKDKDSADWSVFQCWGFESFYGAYLLDQVRGKWEFPELVKMGREFLKKHTDQVGHDVTPVTEAWVEDKASGTSLVQTFRREGLLFREWLPPNAEERVINKNLQLSGPDKVSRAKQSTLPISAGRVFLPYPGMPGFDWSEQFLAEHTAFTADDSHLNDDQVDAETMAILIWLQRGGGTGAIPVWKRLPTWP